MNKELINILIARMNSLKGEVAFIEKLIELDDKRDKENEILNDKSYFQEKALKVMGLEKDGENL